MWTASLVGEGGRAGTGYQQEPALAWPAPLALAIGGLRLRLRTLRQTRIVHVRHPRHSFPFRCSFFLFPLSVLYHTRCIWFARCMYGDYPLSLISVLLVFSINHNCACNVQNKLRHLTQSVRTLKWLKKWLWSSDWIGWGGQEGMKVATLNYKIMQIIIPNFHNMQILPISKSLVKSMWFQI